MDLICVQNSSDSLIAPYAPLAIVGRSFVAPSGGRILPVEAIDVETEADLHNGPGPVGPKQFGFAARKPFAGAGLMSSPLLAVVD